MNKDRRKQLAAVVTDLESALAALEGIRDAEREAFDNMPESLQQSERGTAASEAADSLDERYDELEGVVSTLNELASG